MSRAGLLPGRMKWSLTFPSINSSSVQLANIYHLLKVSLCEIFFYFKLSVTEGLSVKFSSLGKLH